jgi:hypothetical protein
MAGKKRGSKKKSPRRQSSGLKDHRQQKKTLTPPLLNLPKLKLTSWPHTGVPECIWIAAVARETGSRGGPHVPLDVLDEFAPEGREIVDGRITRFAVVPEERRASAREALRSRAPAGLPEDLGHALSLYPECPAFWLFQDWREANELDADRGIAYLKELIESMIPARTSLSAELRMIPIARMAKNGKLRFGPAVETIELLPKYPTYLDAEDRAHVESFARSTWNILQQLDEDDRTEDWGRYFWRHSWEISDCDPTLGEAPVDDDEDLPSDESNGSATSEPTLPEVRARFLDILGTLGNDLRQLQLEAEIDTFDSEVHEVKLGLASRAFRLLNRFVSDPSLWTNEMAPHLVRSMVDERIVVAWLLKQDDPEMFERFKEYGRGKRKLLKLKLEELMDRDDLAAEDVSDLHKSVEAEINIDSMEEFLTIDLGGSFSGKNIRQMAQETDLADLYSLSYQPLSSEAHGEWGSLAMFDLGHCGNPLHNYHRIGRFDTSGRGYIHIGWVRIALGLAEETIADLFDSIGLDTRPLFERCHDAMDEAIQERPKTAA